MPTQISPPDTNAWSRGYATLHEEFSYTIKDIRGTVPPEIAGTVWRNGPGQFDLGGVTYKHPFDGDGMVCALTFQDGKVHFKNRFVRTEGYVQEQKAGQILYKNVFGTLRPGGFLANIFDFANKHVANTGIHYHGNKLLALWEAAPPYKLDPHTLETVGLELLNQELRGNLPFSAHPRLDPKTGVLWNFGIEVGLVTKIHIYQLAPDGRMIGHRIESLTGFAFIHDFVITENYCIFFQNPMALDPWPFLFGFKGAAECLSFAKGEPTRILMIPKDGRPMMKIETDPFFIFHHLNAYEESDKVIVHSVRYEDYLKAEEDKDFRDTDFNNIPIGKLWRMTIDPAKKRVASVKLGDRSCEFPQVAPSVVGKPHRYGYIASAHHPTLNGPMQALWKMDLQGQATQWFSFAPTGFVGEPLFIPHPQATTEDHGWIIQWVYQATDHHTDIVIFDARDITQGPVATMVLAHHVPFGLHGSWSPDFYSQRSVGA